MKQKLLGLVLLALACSSANAALIDRGGGFIYDDVLDITWTKSTTISGQNTWDNQVAWADSLVLYDTVRNVTWNDWRLVKLDVNGDATIDSCGGTELACRDNEFGHLRFFDGITQATPGPFTGIIDNDLYWSGTEFSPTAAQVVAFAGLAGTLAKTTPGYGLAVRDGDVGPGGRIVFKSGNIFTMKANGSAQTPLATTGTGPDSPAWSPDGTRIAYSSSQLFNNQYNTDIYVMNADGSNNIRLTTEAGSDLQPAWSPDGTKIAFVAFRNPTPPTNFTYPNIWVMNADGSNQTRITTVVDVAPAWSPDGTKIAFQSWIDGGYDNIYTVNADGSGRIKLTELIGAYDPAWSPDGTRIAFAREMGFLGDGKWQIYIMDANGSNQVRVSNNLAREGHPTWSPDGSMLAFSTDRDDPGEVKKSEIYVMKTDGSGQTRLTDLPGDTLLPNWQWASDNDGDGVMNVYDNCSLGSNPNQCDSDADGFGNRCDADLNNNGATNAFDTPLFRQQLGQPSVGPTYNKADLNCSGSVNAFDTPLFRSLLGAAPGPSGVVP